MFGEMLKDLYIISFFLFFFVFFSLVFILPYSARLCRKLKKIEPEFFTEKNFCYYMTERNATQFIFYVLFNKCKKIKNEGIKRKCNALRNFSYVVFPCACFVIIMFMVGNYYFSTHSLVT